MRWIQVTLHQHQFPIMSAVLSAGIGSDFISALRPRFESGTHNDSVAGCIDSIAVPFPSLSLNVVSLSCFHLSTIQAAIKCDSDDSFFHVRLPLCVFLLALAIVASPMYD